jgi:hypothetical protein
MTPRQFETERGPTHWLSPSKLGHIGPEKAGMILDVRQLVRLCHRFAIRAAKEVFMRDRHSLWTSHNLELLLWSIVLFAILAVANDISKHVFDKPSMHVSQVNHTAAEVAQSPEM